MVATIGIVLLQELLHRVNQLQVELLLLVEEVLTQLSLQILQILLLTDESVLFLLQACLLALGAFAAEESVTLQFLLEIHRLALEGFVVTLEGFELLVQTDGRFFLLRHQAFVRLDGKGVVQQDAVAIDEGDRQMFA